MAAALQPFQPRPLTVEEKAKLDEAEQDLRKIKGQLEQWLDVVANSPIGSDEEKKAKERKAFYMQERDKAQLQLDMLMVQFGQIASTLVESARKEIEILQGRATGRGQNKIELNFGSVASFLTKQLKAELVEMVIQKKMRLDSSASSDAFRSYEHDVIKLIEPLPSIYGAREKIYVRSQMPSLIKRIIDWLESDVSKSRAMILGGNPGCGKSVIGTLIVLILASRKHVVMYEYGGRRMLVMRNYDEILPLEQEWLQKTFRVAEIPLVREAGAYVFFKADASNQKLSEGLLEEKIIFIQDLGDSTSEIAASMPCRRLIVTSPNARKLEKLHRLPGSEIIILPTWKKEEIDRLDSLVSPKVVTSRWERMGGIPRWVCDAKEGEAEARQDEQIRNLSFKSLTAMILEQSYAEMPSQIDNHNNYGRSTDLVIRLEPRKGDDSKVTAMITSDYVEVELAHRFVDLEEFNVQSFLSATVSSSTLTHFRGYVVEAYAHRALTKESNLQMKVQMLSTMGTEIQSPVSDTQPALRFPTSKVYVEVEQETEVRIDVYYRPKRKNEPTIDGWSVVRRNFVQTHFPNDPRLADETIEFFVVFFQVTVSETHVVDGTVLRRFVKWAKAKLHVDQLPVVFVFITTTTGIRTMQKVTLKNKNKKRNPFDNQAQFGCQYAVQIRGTFENLAARLQRDRRDLEESIEEAFDAAEEGIEEE